MKPKPRIMLSFYYFEGIDLDAWIQTHFDGESVDIFADSGAFTAHNAGGVINIDDYADWVIQNNDRLTTYANLDVIGDPVQSAKNLRRLERRGLKPMPVFHAGDDFKYLDDLVADYDYIGIGGMVGKTLSGGRRELIKYLHTLFDRVAGRARLHAFGTTSYKIITGFDWYSVDSTYWIAGAKWGSIPLYNPFKRHMRYLPLNDRYDLIEHDPVLRHYGFRATDFVLKENRSRRNIVGIGALSYMQIEWHRTKLNPNGSGLRVYLGNAKRDADFRALFDCWQQWQGAHTPSL